jgi:hypothetical protein
MALYIICILKNVLHRGLHRRVRQLQPGSQDGRETPPQGYGRLVISVSVVEFFFSVRRAVPHHFRAWLDMIAGQRGEFMHAADPRTRDFPGLVVAKFHLADCASIRAFFFETKDCASGLLLPFLHLEATMGFTHHWPTTLVVRVVSLCNLELFILQENK